MLVAPAIAVAIQFFLLAAGKPPEYARFGLLIDAFLLVIAFNAAGRLRSAGARRVAAVAIVLLTLPFGAIYVTGFVRDSGGQTSRLAAAAKLKELVGAGATRILVPAEPAPYCMPPVDLFRARLILAPPGHPAPADVIVVTDPRASPAPISWADVRFEIIAPPAGPASGVSSPP